MVIRGHLSGEIRAAAPGLVATVDSVGLGMFGPYDAGHVQRFDFPIPLGDLQLPTAALLVLPTDGWTGSAPLSAGLAARIVPEPGAAWTLLVAGAAWASARRLGRARGPAA